MKVFLFYGATGLIFGLLALGSAEYTQQFSLKSSPVKTSYAKAKSSGTFTLSHDWIRSK